MFWYMISTFPEDGRVSKILWNSTQSGNNWNICPLVPLVHTSTQDPLLIGSEKYGILQNPLDESHMFSLK